jgi:hypothetical protein
MGFSDRALHEGSTGMGKRFFVGQVLGAACFGCSTAALAQVYPAPPLNPHLPPVSVPNSPGAYVVEAPAVPEGSGVADRPRLDYLPVGGRLGSFFLYPNVTVTDRYTDNVRASDAHKFGADSVQALAGAQVISGFTRHQLRAGTWFDRTFVLGHSSENASEYGGVVAGRIDLPQTAVNLGATVERAVVAREDINSPADARSPLRYDRIRGDIGVSHHFNRLGLAAAGSIVRLRYMDVVTDSGAVIDERYQNATQYIGKLAATYTLRPGFDLLAQGVYTRLSYALPPNDPAQPGGLNRDSHGWRTEAGVRLSLTRVLYGEVRLGYLTRDYADPSLKRARGFAYGADLLWNPTGITSVRLNADRRVEEASSTTAAGNRVTDFGVRIEHELLRNLILTTGGRRLRLTPLGPGASSTEWRGDVGAKYLLNHQLALQLAYAHASRSSLDPVREYVENVGTVSVTLSL